MHGAMQPWLRLCEVAAVRVAVSTLQQRATHHGGRPPWIQKGGGRGVCGL